MTDEDYLYAVTVGERVAHNAFIQVGVDLGFLGLGAIFLAFGQTMSRIRQIRRNARAARDREPARARSEMVLAEAGLVDVEIGTVNAERIPQMYVFTGQVKG